MAFNPQLYSIENWLERENDNILQKFCNIIDVDGRLVGQYKTRLIIVPIGNTVPYGGRRGQPAISAPALFRSFTYDELGNRISSLPSIAEWTQACEDTAQGGDDEIENPFLSSGKSGPLPFNWDSFSVDRTGLLEDVYDYELSAVPSGTVTITYTDATKCLISGGAIVVL